MRQGPWDFVVLQEQRSGRAGPVGPAWQRVRKETGRIALYQRDHSHPTPAGSYAAACVFYSVLYGKPVARNPNGSNSAEANLVHRAAWEAVQEFR